MVGCYSVVGCRPGSTDGARPPIDDASNDWPYGSVRSGGVAETDLLFTGQRDEAGDPAGLELYNYKARFYSATLGRFLSADPVAAGNESISLNSYAYVANNPLKYVDPTGMCFEFVGVQIDCGSVDDILAFWNCALTCDNVWGEIARYGIQTEDYWKNVRRYGEGENGGYPAYRLLLLRTLEATADTLTHSPFVRIGYGAWSVLAVEFCGCTGAVFKATIAALVYGDFRSFERVSDIDFVGASDWFTDPTKFWLGGPLLPGNSRDRSGIRERIQSYFLFAEGTKAYIAQRTIDVALRFGAEQVATRSSYGYRRTWSDFQIRTITSTLGWKVKQPARYTIPSDAVISERF